MDSTLSALKLSLVLFLLGVWIAGNGIPDQLDSSPGDTTRTSVLDGISTTVDNQILVELMPEDATPANLFDLNEHTLVFTPDGEGGYSREVQPLAWEEHLGTVVADGTVIALESFTFNFAGQSWDSFYVSHRGLLTFGGLFTYAHYDSETRFSIMGKVADVFVDTPTISPLYKPWLGEFVDTPIREWEGTQHVARWPDRVVVTWITTDPFFTCTAFHRKNPLVSRRFCVPMAASGSTTAMSPWVTASSACSQTPRSSRVT